jgi:hypothetical protein
MKRKPVGIPIDLQYFFDRSSPEPNSGCWIWMNATSPNGYGIIAKDGRRHNAHRVAYMVATNEVVPRHLDVCHRCDIRCCVNPDHLFVGTRKDNMMDCARKGRTAVPRLIGEECPASKLTAEQVRSIRSDTRSTRALARHYGVDRMTIRAVRRHETWKSV